MVGSKVILFSNRSNVYHKSIMGAWLYHHWNDLNDTKDRSLTFFGVSVCDWIATLIKPKPIKNCANIFESEFHDEPHLKNSFQLWKNFKSTNRNLKQLFGVLATWNKHLVLNFYVGVTIRLFFENIRRKFEKLLLWWYFQWFERSTHCWRLQCAISLWMKLT